MLPYCRATGVGVIPWSPLARGRLARPWDSATTRSATDEFGSTLYARPGVLESDQAIVATVADIAAERGVPMAQVALAWVLAQPGVTAPIVGATREHHLVDAVAALDVDLTVDEQARLAAAYVPHPVVGF